MLLTKHRRRKDENPSTSSHRELFGDYPYPIINRLTEEQQRYEQGQESRIRFSSLVSLHWHRDNLHQLADLIHQIHMPTSTSSIIEQSFRQTHLSDRDGKNCLLALPEGEIPTRKRRVSPGFVIPPDDDDSDINSKEQSPSSSERN